MRIPQTTSARSVIQPAQPASLRRMAAWLLAFLPAFAHGQDFGVLEEVVVTAAPKESRVAGPALVLDSQALQERQPVAVSDIFRNVTGISLRTNSRGDSVVRIRGAEERQTLVFLDGAPLATPWDGRTDLALLPAGLIERIEVRRGAAPLEYGANSIAGAVDLVTYVPTQGSLLRAEMQHGSLGLTNVNALGGIALDSGWSFVGGAASIERDAVRIADRSAIEFDPATNRERTNSDYSGQSVFAAAGYAGDSMSWRASVLHADVERGVTAQGHLDPEVSRVRFWRTPDWELTQATLNGRLELPAGVDMRVTGWHQWFDQTIDSYDDYSYTTLQEREKGKDRTGGARLALSKEAAFATFRLVSTFQESTHDQTEFATDTGRAENFVADPTLRYRQQLSTLGLETDLVLSDTVTSTLGIGRDRARTPLTGDKPSQPSLSADGWTAALRWTPTSDLRVAANIGERTRFPTPRELYGVALGRFLLNPDLRPERSLLTDMTIDYVLSEALTFDVAIWSNRSDDTLSQRVVQVDDSSRRQRYNTNGSFTYGIEASTVWALAENFRTEFSFGLQNGESKRDENGERPELLQRPDEQINLALDWQATPRVDLRAEFSYVGGALDLDDDGEIANLPSSTSVNLRGFFKAGSWRRQDILLTASVDNATDTLVLPQLGLPAPGRSYHVGIRIN